MEWTGASRIVDEKYIPTPKIEIPWVMGDSIPQDSIPHSVSTRFLLGSY